jgi:hypothetical protein
MIVQTAPDGNSAFIIRQQDHAAVSGIFAANFGNADFAPLNPKEAMEFLAAHHDDGWESIDANPQFDSRSGFVYHLTQTPTQLLVESGNKSPDANEAFHPYSGLISSMHTYGLYHGRYGLSDKIYIDMINPEWKEAVHVMLAAELARQARLKAVCNVSDAELFHNYKLLQFFDTLALYIQTTATLNESQFLHVPQALGQDVRIRAIPNGNEIRLDPYPFAVDSLEVATIGRIVEKSDSAAAYHSAPMSEQVYTFVRG